MFALRTNWNLSANRLSDALLQQRKSGNALIDLTASNPTEAGLAFDDAAISRALSDPGNLAYKPEPFGLLAAREAVAAYYAARGERIRVRDTILTASTSEAYSFLFRLLCNPGDEVLVPSPSYPLFEFLASIQDVKLARYPLLYDHGWQIDFHALERAITSRTRAILVVNPNNPTGHFAKANEVAGLIELCPNREIALIADEVFLDFCFLPQPQRSFVSNGAGLTFTLSGLSKIAGLPQMKAAWLVASGPDNAKEQALARLEVIADTYLSVSTPIQMALPTFLELRHGFQRQLVSRVRANLRQLDSQLAQNKICSRLEVEGGWNAVLRVPSVRSNEDLAIELVTQKQVIVHPGHFYDFDREGYLVISLIAPEADFAEGIGRLLQMF
jgi:aspartate/methionine/tyrosine aminotransferase